MTKARGLVLLAGAAALAAGVWWWSRPAPVKVVVHSVSRGTVESTVANTRAGTVKACRRARLSLAVGGQIAKLPVHEGDLVEPDQVLLELWNDDLEAELELSRQQLVATQARAEETCTLADVAQNTGERLVRLRAKGLASQEDTEQAVGESKAQRAACRAARTQVQVSAAKVRVDEADLARTILRAPFAGTIAEINGELSEFVTPSPVGIPTPPAVDLIDNACVYVSAPIDEVDAPRIRPGLDTRISLDAFPGQTFPGRVRRVAPYVLDVEKQARTVDVEVDFRPDSIPERLMPGYSADVELLLDRVEDVLRVPTEAILEGPALLVLDVDAGYLRKRAVETGLSNWRWTEVSGGLEAGEKVVTSVDREGVADGARAEAEPE
jgi:HlyD family secretion protein